LERIVTEIHSLNSKAFIRFSGLIGDPLRPSYIAAVFECVSQAGLEWGVTTNGLGDRSRNIPEELYQSLMNANYVHVSLDAGTDETYRRLKRGRTGDFDTVLKHVTEILQRRELRRKDFHRRQDRDVEPAVVVSVLLQPENFRELLAISQRVKDMGVDSVEIKMQHFHADRRMSEREVKEAYRVIDEVRQLDDGRFCVVVVQSEDQAIGKVRGNDVSITFSRCYANELGLNATVDPAGNLQTCCQYYQGTLGPQGCATKLGFGQVWSSDERRATLRRDPREILSDRQDQYQRRCTNCSPSDEFVNRFIDFLRRANEEDPEFLTWAGKQIDSVLGAWKASTGTR
jgi:pyruvate-formate lyase-activating enzyme